MARVRKDGPAAARTYRLSLPLEASYYARLGVLADLGGKSRAEIAAEFVRAALVGVEARDGRKDGAKPEGPPDGKLSGL